MCWCSVDTKPTTFFKLLQKSVELAKAFCFGVNVLDVLQVTSVPPFFARFYRYLVFMKTTGNCKI